MTKRRAERLTGYEIRELPPEPGLCTVSVESPARDPSPQIPVAWGNAPRGEPGTGLPGLPQAHPSDGAVAMSFMNPRTLVRDLAGAITAKEHLARDSGGT